MGRVLLRMLLSASLLVLAAALVLVARVTRYQYLSVTGPALGTKAAAETDIRRVDRWTGTPQVWVCQDIDTNQVANVPPPPSEPADVSTSASDVDAAVRTGAYVIALKRWRSTYPNVDPQTLRVTTSRCAWEIAR